MWVKCLPINCFLIMVLLFVNLVFSKINHMVQKTDKSRLLFTKINCIIVYLTIFLTKRL